jgi:hypothetical protein
MKNCQRTIASDIPTKEECAENGQKDNSVSSQFKIEEITLAVLQKLGEHFFRLSKCVK